MNLYRATENFVYKTDECIGRGATGDVYRGVHKVTGEECALKLCDPRFAQQLQREVEAMKQLQHPNITKFYQLEYDKESTKPILVMELCEKGNLLEVLREPRNAFGLEDKEFLRFFRHLVSGMKHLRQNGFSHRDIKPGNILVYVADDGSYVYKLSDFGTAKPLKDGDFFQSLVGTEEYLHPHIFKAAFIDRYRPREFDISVDLWSLGATLYHAATGKVPFQPYHGRGDKNTMFQMISKKDTGVISGEQTSASGSIIWSKELPKTCMLSKYLRDTLTEFLVRLLECQAHKMWTFDGFFWAADDLLEKHILHLFSVVDSHLYLIYMDPDNKFSDLQKCAQEQMHTQIKSPYFVLHNRELRESVSEEDPVRSYPVTSADDPIVVLPLKEGTLLSTRTSVDSTLSIINEINPEFVDEDSVTRDEDYRMARSMCILTAMILRAIRHAASAHQLLSKTSQSCRYEEQWKFSSLQCSSRCVEERYRDITQIMSTDKRRSLFPIITENGDIDGDNFKQIDNRLDICTSLLEECKEKHKKLDELTKIMDSITQENIEASVERTFKQMTDTLQKFSEYRKLSRLSYHDKKLYTFVKTSMTFHYKHAVSYLKKVQHSMATMFTAFRRWHSAYIKVLEAHKEMDTANTEISRQLQELISNVKEPPPLPSVQKPSMKQRHLSEQVKNRVSVISKDISESKQMALESRDHMERWTKLMVDLVDCELSS
ncbi:inhibitor of nuclear factor kappa-B kinase subunit epsilon-like [Ostrea edulis]|uniref:inhibitor of nuclear factor kappa-B kinase subunit epsilon-like n=1 Tax=Ostrea edulis TaxID=37623 RepID=UPI0024AF43C7|nr:inhibitor of nuclear factor kappa-B kinase subunit epsilon-like [Ostrea edulis]